jgi:YHS domain-containing protein
MAETVTDPVCSMQISPDDAVVTEERRGRTSYFCRPGWHDAFLQDSDRYISPDL